MDLDYVKIVGRLGITRADGSDPNEMPDTVWCDTGTVRFEPILPYTRIVDGTPVPWTAGHSVITATIDSEGYVSLNGVRNVWLIDLGSDKVNPKIPRNKASYRVSFNGIKADGSSVEIPSFTMHPVPGEDNDITLMLPLPVAGGQSIVQGPKGNRGDDGVSIDSLDVEAGNLLVNYSDGSETNLGPLPVGPGGSDEGVASYLASETSESRIVLNNAIVDGQALDFIALAERYSPYRHMEIKKVTSAYGGDPAVEVTCYADSGDHITYVVDNRYAVGDYRCVSAIYEGGTGSTPSGDPMDPYIPNAASSRLDRHTSGFTKAGTWVTDTVHYTAQVGATWKTNTPLTVLADGAVLAFRTHRENRGGMWRLSVIDAETEDVVATADVSCWLDATSPSGASPALITPSALVIPEAGTYHIEGEFLGADPDHAPAGGVPARGWLHSLADMGYIIRVVESSVDRMKTTALKTGWSNPDFAWSIREPEGSYRYIPNHNQGQVVEVPDVAPVFYDGTEVIDLAALSMGEATPIQTSFEWVQSIKGRNVTGGTDLLRISTKQRITPNGVHHVEGAARALASFEAAESSYCIMHIVNPTVLDTLVTCFGVTYDLDPALYPVIQTTTVVGGNRNVGYAAVSSTQPDLIAVERINDPARTVNAASTTVARPSYIEHRSAGVAKVYTKVGWLDAQPISAGEVQRFSGDYFYGRLPGIRRVIVP